MERRLRVLAETQNRPRMNTDYTDRNPAEARLPQRLDGPQFIV